MKILKINLHFYEIQLRKEIVYGDNVKCIVYDTDDTLPQSSGTIMGWGATKVFDLMTNLICKN